MEVVFRKIEAIVTRELACYAHDLEHVKRVYRLCLKLAADFPAVDREVLKAAAWLHDIARAQEDRDPTGSTDHALRGAELAAAILTEVNFPKTKIEPVAHCIASHRFRSGVAQESLEARLLFDADKLDVLGAVGLARSYILAGEYGQPLYAAVPLDEYIRENLVGGVANGLVKDLTKHAINLEYELKFKLIPARLYTARAKLFAADRLKFMEAYFQRMQQEIAGEL